MSVEAATAIVPQPPVATHSNSTTVKDQPSSSESNPTRNGPNGSFSVNISTTNAQPTTMNGTAPVANGHPASNGAASPAVTAASAHAPSTSSSSHSAPALVNKPTFLEDHKYRFLIMDAPNDANIASYIDVLKKKQCVVVARVCDPTYSTAPMLANGIKVVEVPFPDGDPPPQQVVDRWLSLVDQVFKEQGKNVHGKAGVDLQMDGLEKPAIAVHCVAGLGRAPVLVAIALVEAGMEPFDAIAFIRKKRRGAINARQLKYIENYQPKRNARGGCCTIQ